MDKLKVGVIFGGMSTEHDVSIASGTSIITELNKDKYDIYPIFIDKDGKWYKCLDISKKYKVGESISDIELITNIVGYLNSLDVLFPILHGLYGEDGTIQGLFELLKIPYVGCRVLGSCVAMDKVYSKLIFDRAKIKQAKYEYIKKEKDNYIYVDKEFNEIKSDIEDICNLLEGKLKYPMYVKPSNSGSSVGISRALNTQELINSIKEAFNYDRKVLIEEEIVGREVECSVLGNNDIEASCIGEIIIDNSFYSYESKYNDPSSKTIIPDDIDSSFIDEIRNTAIKAFKAIDGKGFARVDFFIDDKNKEIFINEINTLPGFTNISMYPKLWEESGLAFSKLLDKLIELAINFNR